MRYAIALAALLLVSPASAQIISRTFYAQGLCTGLDQVVILSPAWEDRPIMIRKVTVGLQLSRRWYDILRGRQPGGYIFAGNSYAPDVMALQIGPGAVTVDFPADAAFTLPASSEVQDDHAHIDAHVSCSPGSEYSAWLVIYYKLNSG